MMIRFQRIGRKNDPAFRMLVLEKASGPKAGKYVDQVGTYNPKTKAMTVDGDKIKGWMAKGAQVSPSLMNLLVSKSILEGKKVNVLPKKHPIKSAEAIAAEAAAAEAAKNPPAPAAEVVAEEAPAAEETVEVSEEEAAPVVAEAEPAAEEEAVPAEVAEEAAA